MQGIRILEARDHIAQAAYAAMRRVEAEAARSRLSRTPRDTAGGYAAASANSGSAECGASAAGPWERNVSMAITIAAPTSTAPTR
jgi:hypothetical protein